MHHLIANSLAPELFWLLCVALLTSLLWAPYVVHRIFTVGMWGALKNPKPETLPTSGWAYRSRQAHANAVENLTPFAAIVLVAVIAEKTSDIIALAAFAFVAARALHAIVYTLGIPVVRTLAFQIGWAAQIAIGLVVLGVI